ncbi:GntR family transcriptional regulator [Algimonas arctica]|uniref:GntR family transcriptional regulator n=1 Tax=Algimonas arctica TaxID=1479486 RepID=A0A8J3G1W1_9PROT|nr:FadR/GntR family transcriptional regulator [Algimonas arctica]GHA90130.1 GntR family transcriptional regulator [Algimonas arctica]
MADKRLYHQVADQIVDLIDSGAFPPGNRLPGERDLARRFDVSRVSIREAEIALQAVGRLDVRVGSGAYVLDPADGMFGVLPVVTAFELTEARALFEAETAALAAPIISKADLDHLEQLIQIMAADPDVGVLSAEEADQDFHRTIAKATNNPAITHTIENLWHMRSEAVKVQSIYTSVCEKDVRHRAQEHRNILDALKARDSVAARTAMRAHFTRMIEALLIASEAEAYRQVKQQASESRSRFLISARLD